jgi:hypothetical protein
VDCPGAVHGKPEGKPEIVDIDIVLTRGSLGGIPENLWIMVSLFLRLLPVLYLRDDEPGLCNTKAGNQQHQTKKLTLLKLTF